MLLGVTLLTGTLGCPFARWTGWPCPGCGTTRAIGLLLAGDVRAAWRLQPVAPWMVLHTLMYALCMFVKNEARGSRLSHNAIDRVQRLAAWGLALGAVIEAVLWVARFFGAWGGPVPVYR